jgi:hypothetical protein
MEWPVGHWRNKGGNPKDPRICGKWNHNMPETTGYRKGSAMGKVCSYECL